MTTVLWIVLAILVVVVSVWALLAFIELSDKSYLDGYTYAKEALARGEDPKGLYAMSDGSAFDEHDPFDKGVRKALFEHAQLNGGEPA
jgi:hypothetical protein